ncbi:hypothetical protein BDN70DRAFT_939477 [Pholiota conissans]|uniref:Uncharacterized protein n=1 Tax=Pholiota conissans TaxID=109636 RepID=A0A9P6CSL9_9AGAR|nr:hypothetical protein BDN70DRAFT_939477 [Pholiota conissans]
MDGNTDTLPEADSVHLTVPGGPSARPAPPVESSLEIVLFKQPQFPSEDQLASLSSLFSTPETPPMEVSKHIGSWQHSRFVVIWNLPVSYLWDNIVYWSVSLLPHLETENKVLERILQP